MIIKDTAQIRAEAFNSLGFQVDGANISIYFYSQRRNIYTVLDLTAIETLSVARKEKLKLGNYILVAEMANGASYAMLNQVVASQTQAQEMITISGKTLKVKTLTDEEAERLKQVGESLENFIVITPHENSKESHHRDQRDHFRHSHGKNVRDYLSYIQNTSTYTFDKIRTNVLFFVEQLKMGIAQSFSENTRAEAARSKKANQEKMETSEQIKEEIIRKEILRDGVETDEVKRDKVKRTTAKV